MGNDDDRYIHDSFDTDGAVLPRGAHRGATSCYRLQKRIAEGFARSYARAKAWCSDSSDAAKPATGAGASASALSTGVAIGLLTDLQ